VEQWKAENSSNSSRAAAFSSKENMFILLIVLYVSAAHRPICSLIYCISILCHAPVYLLLVGFITYPLSSFSTSHYWPTMHIHIIGQLCTECCNYLRLRIYFIALKTNMTAIASVWWWEVSCVGLAPLHRFPLQ
jgi:hypothetical protein